MKNIIIQYATTERKYISEFTYCHLDSTAEVKPLRIFKRPVGRNGAARDRFYYEIECIAPIDAQFKRADGVLRTSINRQKNPSFTPKNLDFVNNTYENPELLETNP